MLYEVITYEAIKAGDSELAVQLIRRHVKTACEWNKALIKVHQLTDIKTIMQDH